MSTTVSSFGLTLPTSKRNPDLFYSVRRLAAVTWFVVLGVSLCNAQTPSDDLVAYLVRQNEQSRKKFDRTEYSFDFEWINRQVVGIVATGKQLGQGQVVYDGQRRNINVIRNIIPDGQIEKTDRRHIVLNDEYGAYWSGGSTNVERIDHESLANRPDRSSRLFQETNPLAYAFGITDGSTEESLSQFVENNAGSIWTAQEVSNLDGSTVFQLNRRITPLKGNSWLASRYEIDPEKDFLVIKISNYFKDGSLMRVANIGLKQDEDSQVWRPANIEEISFKRNSSVGVNDSIDLEDIKWSRTMRINHIQTDIPEDPSQFTLEAMSLPDGVFVIRETVGGEKLLSRWREGKLIPDKVDQFIRDEEYRAKHLPEAIANLSPSTTIAKADSTLRLSSLPSESTIMAAEMKAQNDVLAKWVTLLSLSGIFLISVSVVVRFVKRRQTNTGTQIEKTSLTP